MTHYESPILLYLMKDVNFLFYFLAPDFLDVISRPGTAKPAGQLRSYHCSQMHKVSGHPSYIVLNGQTPDFSSWVLLTDPRGACLKESLDIMSVRPSVFQYVCMSIFASVSIWFSSRATLIKKK